MIAPNTLFVDSQKSAICLANNPTMYHKQSKHINIKYHWIREKVRDEDGVVRFLHVSSGEMVADVLISKALATDIFEKTKLLCDIICPAMD